DLEAVALGGVDLASGVAGAFAEAPAKLELHPLHARLVHRIQRGLIDGEDVTAEFEVTGRAGTRDRGREVGVRAGGASRRRGGRLFTGADRHGLQVEADAHGPRTTAQRGDVVVPSVIDGTIVNSRHGFIARVDADFPFRLLEGPSADIGQIRIKLFFQRGASRIKAALYRIGRPERR